ncbi:MAG TPA: NAD(P)-binding domain-containing protein [Ktedonobacterales bacterium]|nr:NAD(P)-binding domain-containing protein [Ktedonobacterales bacterium]
MATFHIAVLGAGKVGGTLGSKWVAAGHTVTFGVRDLQSSDAQSLRSLGGSVTVGTVVDALSAAPQIVVMALPGGAMDEAITTYAAQLDGRVIIDVANRLGGGGPANSLSTFQERAPNARVYRAFNTYGFENFANPVYGGVQADMFYAGPEGDSQAQVEQLISEVGLRPMRLGGVDQFSTVDSLLGLWFTLARLHGRHLAFKVLTD